MRPGRVAVAASLGTSNEFVESTLACSDLTSADTFVAAQPAWLRCSIRARLDQFEKVNVRIRLIRTVLRIEAVADDESPPQMHYAKRLRSATGRDGRLKLF